MPDEYGFSPLLAFPAVAGNPLVAPPAPDTGAPKYVLPDGFGTAGSAGRPVPAGSAESRAASVGNIGLAAKFGMHARNPNNRPNNESSKSGHIHQRFHQGEVATAWGIEGEIVRVTVSACGG